MIGGSLAFEMGWWEITNQILAWLFPRTTGRPRFCDVSMSSESSAHFILTSLWCHHMKWLILTLRFCTSRGRNTSESRTPNVSITVICIISSPRSGLVFEICASLSGVAFSLKFFQSFSQSVSERQQSTVRNYLHQCQKYNKTQAQCTFLRQR